MEQQIAMHASIFILFFPPSSRSDMTREEEDAEGGGVGVGWCVSGNVVVSEGKQ